jgi:hypothetical protein
MIICLEVLVLTRSGEIRDQRTACDPIPNNGRSFRTLDRNGETNVVAPWAFNEVTCPRCRSSQIWWAVPWLSLKENRDRHAVLLDEVFELNRDGIAAEILRDMPEDERSLATAEKRAQTEADEVLRRLVAEQATLQDGRIRSWWTWGQPNSISPAHVTFVGHATETAQNVVKLFQAIRASVLRRSFYEKFPGAAQYNREMNRYSKNDAEATLALMKIFGEESPEGEGDQ